MRKLTEDEIRFLKAYQKNGYRYIARDRGKMDDAYIFRY